MKRIRPSEHDALVCLERGADHMQTECEGPVELRMPLSGTGVSFPRCDRHWELRLTEQARIDRLYAPNSDVPPPDFDPTYTGESWEEE